MGEMTLRNLDEALLVELNETARRRGIGVENLAADLLRSGLRQHRQDRAAVARAILAAQPHAATTDSVDLIREDRER